MKLTLKSTFILPLSLACLCSPLIFVGQVKQSVKIPQIEGGYINIYKPKGDTFPKPSIQELKAGHFYNDWVPNDHTFIKGDDGCWHIFGITHPLTSFQRVHDGENMAFHAVSPRGSLKQTLIAGSWKDKTKVLTPVERPGDRDEHQAPTVTKKNGLYFMIWGPQAPLRYATSKDLYKWEYKGKLENTPDQRDPDLFLWKGIYYMVTCGGNRVNLSASKDLLTWTKHEPILILNDNLDAESPSLICYNNTFYLIICGWNHIWDEASLDGAYQHLSYVYRSDDIFKFDTDNLVTTLDAHAPQIIQDEKGDWYISSAEWPYRGVSIARLIWK